MYLHYKNLINLTKEPSPITTLSVTSIEVKKMKKNIGKELLRLLNFQSKGYFQLTAAFADTSRLLGKL